MTISLDRIRCPVVAHSHLSSWPRHRMSVSVGLLSLAYVRVSASNLNGVMYSDYCLDALNNTLALSTGSADLIHLDPSFNSDSTCNLPFPERDEAFSTKEDRLLTGLVDPEPRHASQHRQTGPAPVVSNISSKDSRSKGYLRS